jgi:hypothetical protein
MSLNSELPEEVLGPEPKHATLEAMLLFLISEDKMSVARAGETLNFDRMSAIRWDTSHGCYYSDLSQENLAEDFQYARKS